MIVGKGNLNVKNSSDILVLYFSVVLSIDRIENDTYFSFQQPSECDNVQYYKMSYYIVIYLKTYILNSY